MNTKHSQVLLVFRKNPRKWNYGWSSVLKTSTALIVGIFERFCFDEVFLMALTSTEQLFLERPLYRLSCIMITYPISSNLCKKSSLQCYRLDNCPFFSSRHWRCSVRKRCSWKFRKIHRKTFLIFLVSSLEDFLFIPFQQKNEMKKGKYHDGAQVFTFLLGYWFVWRQRFQKKFDRCNLIRICCCNFHG